MENNEVLNTINSHRSIRKFTKQKLTSDEIEKLIQAASRTSNSMSEQQYSIISVTDPKKLAKLGEITLHHLPDNAGHFLLFIADQHRNAEIIKHHNPDANLEALHSADKFLASVHDVDLSVQSTLLAAESMGLGGTIMGSIYNNPKEIIKMFNLPKLTFPVLGLAIGHPDEKPDLKPRINTELMHSENTYKEPDMDLVKKFDKKINQYYKSRNKNQRDTNFFKNIWSDISKGDYRKDLLPTIKEQGFLIN
ncbi:nitroreductase family protein [Apilactobacillus apisilvae]|uniref:Nitroreductase family protein n=1 Tax=Apilactobacillus apisilvae TaxID=2923364 RepID=A0ABY4PGW5_9LACO|nr:nitroreductase family protein [Apilactobacillus apisilvae]UQS84612.1 nitroreductase family protein [Apilactobacillus apisilvae]